MFYEGADIIIIIIVTKLVLFNECLGVMCYYILLLQHLASSGMPSPARPIRNAKKYRTARRTSSHQEFMCLHSFSS